MSENLMRIWPKLNKNDKEYIWLWANSTRFREARISKDELIFMPMKKLLWIMTHIESNPYAKNSKKWIRELREKLGEEVDKVHG